MEFLTLAPANFLLAQLAALGLVALCTLSLLTSVSPAPSSKATSTTSLTTAAVAEPTTNADEPMQPPRKTDGDLWQELMQIGVGTDLTSFALPPSFLLPFSAVDMAVLNFTEGAGPQWLLRAPVDPDPVSRILALASLWLGGACRLALLPWGKKPYNPVLGELLLAQEKPQPLDGASSTDSPLLTGARLLSSALGWSAPSMSGPRATVSAPSWRICAEQTSHHPPITAYAVEANPGGGASLRCYGCSLAQPLFRGNTIEVQMSGQRHIELTRPSGAAGGGGGGKGGKAEAVEVYTQHVLPSLCARGVFAGRRFMEWTGETQIVCEQTGLEVTLRFEPAGPLGLFGQDRHGVSGEVRRRDTGEVLSTIGGQWDGDVVATRCDQDGAAQRLLMWSGRNVGELTQLPSPPAFKMPRRSLGWARHTRRVWGELTRALLAGEWTRARLAKHGVEHAERRARADRTTPWRPRFFAQGTQPERPFSGSQLDWAPIRDEIGRAFEEGADEQQCAGGEACACGMPATA